MSVQKIEQLLPLVRMDCRIAIRKHFARDEGGDASFAMGPLFTNCAQIIPFYFCCHVRPTSFLVCVFYSVAPFKFIQARNVAGCCMLWSRGHMTSSKGSVRCELAWSCTPAKHELSIAVKFKIYRSILTLEGTLGSGQHRQALRQSTHTSGPQGRARDNRVVTHPDGNSWPSINSSTGACSSSFSYGLKQNNRGHPNKVRLVHWQTRVEPDGDHAFFCIEQF